jgi:hypothetical protein
MLYLLNASCSDQSAMKSDSNRDLQAAVTAPCGEAAMDQADAAQNELRSDAVNRARELIANPNYPDAAVVQKIAGHLANHLQTPPADK